jgi:hypothetical protein
VRSITVIAMCLCFFLFDVSAFADEIKEAIPAASARTRSQRVELIPDQKSGALRVVIDGKPVAWFDADGLHVLQNIEYGGTVSDTGTEHLEKQARGARAH